jgi:nucleotide-binding universal stress UspA family protein
MNRTHIGRIVVGVDGSEAAARALEWAIGLAAPLDAEVIAVYAYELPAYVPRPGGAPYVPEQENWERALRQDFELCWCAPLAEAGVRHRTIFEIGHAGDVLLREAETVVADLIVTGRRGRGELVELLGGSVSQRLVHGAHCPVVVVPPVAVARALEPAAATA